MSGVEWLWTESYHLFDTKRLDYIHHRALCARPTAGLAEHGHCELRSRTIAILKRQRGIKHVEVVPRVLMCRLWPADVLGWRWAGKCLFQDR